MSFCRGYFNIECSIFVMKASKRILSVFNFHESRWSLFPVELLHFTSRFCFQHLTWFLCSTLEVYLSALLILNLISHFAVSIPIQVVFCQTIAVKSSLFYTWIILDSMFDSIALSKLVQKMRSMKRLNSIQTYSFMASFSQIRS